jgi:hypothetical protein
MSILDGDPNFYKIVRLLRTMSEENRHRALYAAMFWSDDKLDGAERNGDLPGQPGEMKPDSANLN